MENIKQEVYVDFNFPKCLTIGCFLQLFITELPKSTASHGFSSYLQAYSVILEALHCTPTLVTMTSAQNEILAASIIALLMMIPERDPKQQVTLFSLPLTWDSLIQSLCRKRRVNLFKEL